MSVTDHLFEITTAWSSDRGTADYRSYSRAHTASAEGPGTLEASADRAFHGDADRWNPEQLLVSALSSCHMLSFLHQAVLEGVTVTGYTDRAVGRMALNPDHSGQFEEVLLRPEVTAAEPLDAALLERLHERAHEVCFIARSVSFPVRVEAAGPASEVRA